MGYILRSVITGVGLFLLLYLVVGSAFLFGYLAPLSLLFLLSIYTAYMFFNRTKSKKILNLIKIPIGTEGGLWLTLVLLLVIYITLSIKVPAIIKPLFLNNGDFIFLFLINTILFIIMISVFAQYRFRIEQWDKYLKGMQEYTETGGVNQQYLKTPKFSVPVSFIDFCFRLILILMSIIVFYLIQPN